MPFIKDGTVQDDTYTHVGPDEALPDGAVSVPLARFLEAPDQLLARNTAAGVRLEPEDDPAALESHLDRLSLITVNFPKYTDGRGYSQAQLLRRRMGYRGELRAVGHVLRDQILYMHRSGFDAFETERADLPTVQEALRELSAYYQPAADGARSVFAARHAAADQQDG